MMPHSSHHRTLVSWRCTASIAAASSLALSVAGCQGATPTAPVAPPAAASGLRTAALPAAAAPPAAPGSPDVVILDGQETQLETASEPALAGIDVLIKRNFGPLRGKRIALVTNQTGVTRDRRATIDVLNNAPGIKLIALFTPEHGLRGQVSAGKNVSSGRDSVTGLPVYSLYGGSQRPSRKTLRGVQVLVFDLQDIGSRSYTYIATLGECMRACAEQGIPFVVLDRPNPLGDHRLEGNEPEERYRSFVCPYPIPYRYGLTIGELAGMINGRNWTRGRKKCALTVIPLQGYRRSMSATQNGLPWVQTSPNVPAARTPLFYAATGIAGELSSISVGIGTKVPFEVVGAPGLNGQALASELTRRGLPGCRFRPAQWHPVRGVFKGELCSGVHINFPNASIAPLTRLNFEIMDAIRKIAPRHALFGRSRNGDLMFDWVCGTKQVRQMFLSGRSAKQIWEMWNKNEKFAIQRQPYLLYR